MFNIPAVIVVVACAFLLLRGATESAKVNTIMVFIKIGILLFFCAIAFTAFEPGNFAPFAPLGVAGISAAAGQVFFSYIGFDAASTAGEEAKNAKKDLPSGDHPVPDHRDHPVHPGHRRRHRRPPLGGVRRCGRRGGAGEHRRATSRAATGRRP